MIWITRGARPKLNRDTGQVAEGGFASRIAGPDGVSNSAMRFDATEHLELPTNKDLTKNFTIQFGYKR